MITRVTRRVVLVVLAGLTLAGCGRQARDPSRDMDLLAAGPDSATLQAAPPFVAAAIEATGSLTAWTQCRKLTFDAVVTAYRPDDSFYLTQHKFYVCPWGDAIQVSAQEPQASCACRVIQGQYLRLDGEEKADVSPLRASYRDYAEAVLQITTAPARMLNDGVTLLRRPMPVMIRGAWYFPVEAKYAARQVAARGDRRGKATIAEPYWTQGIYFQDQASSLVDIIWLGNPNTQRFLLVRGYNYARIVDNGVLIPTKIEVFQSDAEVAQGRRLALVDLKQ
ncbi:MAG: hypothetical protein JW955_06735 [Sedimentisphaerales bacterium]|nr:hypothetical protein [Sedimentisphaerales bacterium]